ncbi:hypothetical protein GDO86_016393 [Hymenochirus boettgeri]|uniref:P2X purinoreceptor 7 intracellular domain-containing protein n=1 Tax=Hymenochirus boettgeri TaxID=247094 RepID=A0A8T2K299_9PIPI|nr:hypothetical protein GDO86_016393 [Hymenochirus boettgeri]
MPENQPNQGSSRDVDNYASKRGWDGPNEQLDNRPERGKGTDSSDGSLSDSSDFVMEDVFNRRVGNISWCTCGNCSPMQTEVESYCCQDIGQIREQIPEDSLCITENPEVIYECTDYRRVDLDMKMMNPHLSEYPKDEDLMRYMREASYRSFKVVIYEFLGGKNRKLIPSCMLTKIRDTFPDYDVEEMALE